MALEVDGLEPIRLGLHRMQRMLANRRSWSSLAEAAGVELPQQVIQVLLDEFYAVPAEPF